MNKKELLKRLVETESPTGDKAGVDRVGSIVAEEARILGADVKIVSVAESGNHILSKWGGDKVGILIICHMDTVFPVGTLAKVPFRESDGKIFGPGVLDMKAGIVIGLAAIEDARKNGSTRPVTLLCTGDEEVGSLTSRELIAELGREAELALIMEPGLMDGSVKTWRKGVGEFWIKTKGRAAHAGGDHEQGRNAIEEMAHQVIAVQKLTDYSRQTTLNVGVIKGGTVSNVVPEECVVQVDVRVMQQGEWERLDKEMSKLKPVIDGTVVEVTGSLNRGPMPFDETMRSTFEKINTIASGIGMELKAGGTGGASDGNLIASLGVPLLDGLGGVGEGYHSDREYIFEESLEQRTKLLSAIIQNW